MPVGNFTIWRFERRNGCIEFGNEEVRPGMVGRQEPYSGQNEEMVRKKGCNPAVFGSDELHQKVRSSFGRCVRYWQDDVHEEAGESVPWFQHDLLRRVLQ